MGSLQYISFKIWYTLALSGTLQTDFGVWKDGGGLVTALQVLRESKFTFSSLGKITLEALSANRLGCLGDQALLR